MGSALRAQCASQRTSLKLLGKVDRVAGPDSPQKVDVVVRVELGQLQDRRPRGALVYDEKGKAAVERAGKGRSYATRPPTLS